MNKSNPRRTALKQIAGTAAAVAVTGSLTQCVAAAEQAVGPELKGKINHSVARWCYAKIPLDELCLEAKRIGLASVELQGPDDWPTIKKHGLTCAMPWGAEISLSKGFNNPAYHDELVQRYEAILPKVAAAGYDKVICFSGDRDGKMTDEQGMAHAATGLKRLMRAAEQHRVTLVMELLNSKVDHKGYMCDTTPWGVALCDQVGSDRFKLLYDIYHMQIMEGDVIATIRKYHPYFAHYHTGGVPGRNEIDETQELQYPAIMRAIVDTGYKGFVGQEFVPKREPLVSLAQGVKICDVG